MEDDSYKSILEEEILIRDLKLYKCVKEDEIVNGEVLFLFRLSNVVYSGEPGSLTKEITSVHPPECTRVTIDSSSLVNLGDDEFSDEVYRLTSVANLCLYEETDQELARRLICLIRSCYRFGLGVLSLSSEYSLVFVVDVLRSCATRGFIEGKMKSLFEKGSNNESSYVDDGDDDVAEKGNGSEESSSYVDTGDDDMADEKGSSMMSEELSDVDTADDDMASEELSDVDSGDDDMADDEKGSTSMSEELSDVDNGDDDMADESDRDEEEMDDPESVEKAEAWNDLVNSVRTWQLIPTDSDDPILQEITIKPLIKYERLGRDSRIGNDYVITKEEEERGECAICLAPYPGKVKHNAVFTWLHDPNVFQHLVRLCCGHAFHYDCIFEWLEKNPTCPLCRSVNYVRV